MNLPRYALISAARNEAEFIRLTMDSVVAQTLRPVRWIIVSDGSTDATDDIVREYAADHDWIELVRMPARAERHFGGKVACFQTAYARLRDVPCELIGNLDADISFEPGYYAFLLERFAENPRLGIGGTPFAEGNSTYNFQFSSVEHVSGACQMFRRECYDEIGGYVPMPCGGIDVIAVLSARMKGWQTRTFPEKICQHHRVMGSAKSKRLLTGFRLGQKDYLLGRHPLWQTFRSMYQMTRRPYVIGGATLFWGYFWTALKREPRPVSAELVQFQRREQMQRLKKFLTRA